MLLKALLLFGALVTIAIAEVPSYIHVCGRRDPNLNDCIRRSVEALRGKLKEGIPELDVPPIEPFQIDLLKIADLPNFKAYAHNVTVTGFSDFEILDLQLNLDKRELLIETKFKQITMMGTYDINTRILVPISGKGPVKISSENHKSKAKLNFDYYDRGNKTYMYFSAITVKMFIEDYNAELGSDSGNPALQQAINQVLGNSHKEIIEATKPTIEKYTGEKCLEYSNNICKHFTLEELFPDRE